MWDGTEVGSWRVSAAAECMVNNDANGAGPERAKNSVMGRHCYLLRI